MEIISSERGDARLCRLPERRRRRRISITAGEESEANVTCGAAVTKRCVLEEGEHRGHVQLAYVRPLRGCPYLIHVRTAGFAAFGSSTSGYGYSPPSATLSRDDNQLKMCLLCTCESLVIYPKVLDKKKTLTALAVKASVHYGLFVFSFTASFSADVFCISSFSA